MKIYGTEQINGRYMVSEFNWYYGRDANKLSNYQHIEDAIDEANNLNVLIEYYEKLIDYQE